MLTTLKPTFLKRFLLQNFIFILAVVLRLWRALRQKLKLLLFYQRDRTILLFDADIRETGDRPKVLVMIPHVVFPQDIQDPQKRQPKVDRLCHTLDGLLDSFAHCDLEIWIQTLPDHNVVQFLPEYLRCRIHIEENKHCDPLYISYSIQDKLMERLTDGFDWFLHLEDDIVIHDSSYLHKLTVFNTHCPDPRGILTANRYEMLEGTKRYIDLNMFRGRNVGWDKLSVFDISGVKYAECENPHAGLYCLNATQLKRWAQSPRDFKNLNFMVGPLESAITFSLCECFTIYKPHPQNIQFLEVEHYDTKYSKQIPALSSPYTISAIAQV